MIHVTFDDIYQAAVNGQDGINITSPCTLKELLRELFSRFPQLYVRLMDDPALMQRTLLVLNDALFLEHDDSTVVLVDGDCIHFLELPKGSGETVVLFLETYVLGYVMSGLSASLVAGLVDAVVGMAVSMALQMALSAIMGAIFGDMAQPDANMGISNSATYTFDGVKNTSYSGAPIHVVYGEHRVGGNILNVYVSNEYTRVLPGASLLAPVQGSGNVYTSNLNMQIGLCEGEIEGASDLYINKMPSNFYNGVGTPETRTGTAGQELMLNYSRVESTTSVGRKILCMQYAADNSRLDFSSLGSDALFQTSIGPSSIFYAVVEKGTDGSLKVVPGIYKVPRVWY